MRPGSAPTLTYGRPIKDSSSTSATFENVSGDSTAIRFASSVL
jgi:hypothetical protein